MFLFQMLKEILNWISITYGVEIYEKLDNRSISLNFLGISFWLLIKHTANSP